MATSHWSPSPGTCHTDLSVENKELTLNLNVGVSKNQEVVGGDEQKAKSSNATASKPRGQNYVAMA